MKLSDSKMNFASPLSALTALCVVLKKPNNFCC